MVMRSTMMIIMTTLNMIMEVEDDYEDDKMTEFTNGSWDVGEFQTLEDCIKFLKEEYIPGIL